MRLLLAGAIALLAVSTTTPALAATPLPVAASDATVQMHPSAGETTVLASSKKKKKKKTTKNESVSIENIATVKRGKRDFEIVAKLSKSDRTCELQVKWADGTKDKSEEVDADGKRCEMVIDVPNERDVVGKATATVTVRDGKGKKVGTAQKTFMVK